MLSADFLHRFIYRGQAIRGEAVILDETFHAILSNHSYPEPVRKLVGETVLSALMLAATVKIQGQLTIQFQDPEGAIRLLVAKCTHDMSVRATARWDDEASIKALQTSLMGGQLVITIEQAHNVRPYQSIVPIRRMNVAQALEFYFKQSEQLPSRFILAVGKDKAVGLMWQQLPDEATEKVQAFWRHLNSQIDLLQADDVLEHDIADLLTQMSPDCDIETFAPDVVSFHCPCSKERMEVAIRTLGLDEANTILSTRKEIVVTCEYCHNEYAFSKHDVWDLFAE